MSLKRYIGILLIATVFFVTGVLVGRFVMPRQIQVTVVDVKDLVEIIERYNELKYELEKIKEWNKDAVTESAPEEGESEKNN